MRSTRRPAVMTLVCMLLWSAPLAAQSDSPSLVRQLTTLLEGAKLDTLAAGLPGTDDSFVAARYFPGQQLIVVSGRYAVPVLLKEKILLKRYGDAYLDLYSASDRASRRIVEDLRADGLRPVQRKGEPFDIYTRRGGESIAFDGEWKRRKLSEQTYMDSFRHADAVYGDMLKILIAALRPSAATASGVGLARSPDSAIK
jgi:hypothetical protein